MACKSAEYWAAAPSSEYQQQCDAAEALGRLHAQQGWKPNARGIYGTPRTFYFLGYKSVSQGVAA